MAYLTRRQQEVLRFIRARLAAEGVAPTLQEISAAFGFSSTASAQKHIAALEDKGYLQRVKHQKRGLVLAPEAVAADTATTELPLLGHVAAGAPIESISDHERISVPAAMVRGHARHYALRVRGDSMVEDGIHDGDVVVVAASHEARQGQAVVALVNGEVTLKRLYREPDGRVRLQPSNPTMAPLRVSAAEVSVQGLLVGLLRRY